MIMGNEMSGPMDPYIPPTRIRLTKEQAGEISVGDDIKVHVSGKVAGIQQTKSYDHKKKKDIVTGYEVELEKSSVVAIENNPARAALKEMMKDND